eukprot:CAMPEP_0195084184 /NCGR_PEP_ID=MMETSP0448-20130528/24920_1 /TAXON_ID=66468 /ORGANISM="Heterocapsa triquestra, Strain CCMP 448" /LENGTH=204 /DNA_ID=CAMNT_0040117469 /DNA_START=3 /DNA_END=617 /DNA_ORIENTATION=+
MPEAARTCNQDPFGIVISTADANVSAERVFDVTPGQLVVQRCMGNIAGRKGGCLFASIEYAIKRWNPSLLLVMGDTDCISIKTALEQVDGHEVSTSMMSVLEMVQPAALRASDQVSSSPDNAEHTAAGKQMKVTQLAVELNALYTIECLMTFSETVREAVRTGKLELHAAMLDRLTGQVEFIGEHPMVDTLVRQGQQAKANASH